MSSSPAYAATPNIGSQLLTNSDASYTAPSVVSTLLTAGANGTRVNRVVVKAVATTVAGKLLLWLYDGTTYHLYDEFDITAVTLSTTVDAFRVERAYYDLVMKTGWSLRATLSVTQTGIMATALAGDL